VLRKNVRHCHLHRRSLHWLHDGNGGLPIGRQRYPKHTPSKCNALSTFFLHADTSSRWPSSQSGEKLRNDSADV
jgi:hypothetical protein